MIKPTPSASIAIKKKAAENPPRRTNVRQVNHDVANATAECNTNCIESLHAAILRAERGVYHHISQNYLDFYVAETAWRQEHPKRTKLERVHHLLTLTARRGRSSVLRGYYQHRRRRLPMVWATHRVGRAPSPAPQENVNASAFTVLSVRDFLADPKAIPEQPEVYALMLKGGRQLFADYGVPLGGGDKPPWKDFGIDHLYTGEAGSLRSRVADHLLGDVEHSNLRQTMVGVRWQAMQQHGLKGDISLGTLEADLTSLLQASGLIAFRACAYPGEVEALPLKSHQSPLNIQRAGLPSARTRHLRHSRAALRRDFSRQWPKSHRKRVRR